MDGAYDAVVVGSGFGGGITAWRLAERGWRVCMLERGRRFGPGDYPDRPEQAPRMFWHPQHNPGGMFDLPDDADAGVIDDSGKVHNYDGPYVLDGSIVATAIGVKASRTIAARAERGVERLLAEPER